MATFQGRLEFGPEFDQQHRNRTRKERQRREENKTKNKMNKFRDSPEGNINNTRVIRKQFNAQSCRLRFIKHI